MAPRRPWLIVCAAISVFGLVSLSAHPVATTSITIAVDSASRVEVSVDTNPDALLMKLEALAGGEPTPVAQAPRSQEARLTALHATLERLMNLEADSIRVPLTLVGIDAGAPAPDGPRVTVRLAGALPDGSPLFMFSSSLVYGSYPLIVRRAGVPEESVEWLAGPQHSQSYAPGLGPTPAGGLASVRRDFLLGFTHILPNGLDHILFVLGLFLLSTRLRSVLAQVSAFTLAHSITLGLTLYGVVAMPASIVEPLIAISIVYVACENLWTSNLTPWRLALVFAFGLLHGMGFAEALGRLHLARANFLTTLVSFNVGVEAGQLTIVAGAALAVWAFGMARMDYRRLVVRPGSLAIALTGVFWTIERLW